MTGTGPWEHCAHDADLGVRGYGVTLAAAFEQTARLWTRASMTRDPLTLGEDDSVIDAMTQLRQPSGNLAATEALLGLTSVLQRNEEP